jgi:hypothetical protein
MPLFDPYDTGAQAHNISAPDISTNKVSYSVSIWQYPAVTRKRKLMKVTSSVKEQR